jgi:hypothetical protein
MFHFHCDKVRKVMNTEQIKTERRGEWEKRRTGEWGNEGMGEE